MNQSAKRHDDFALFLCNALQITFNFFSLEMLYHDFAFFSFRNPVSNKGGRSTVGWPFFTSLNRYILRIDESAPKEIESRSEKVEDVFVPIIELDRNEESCAFWNKLVPFLQRSHEEKCRSGFQ